jgi:hypothetical protein
MAAIFWKCNLGEGRSMGVVTHWKWAGMSCAGLALLVSSGCGGQKRADAPQLNTEMNRYVARAPEAQPPSSVKLYRPRTQAELDAAFALPAPVRLTASRIELPQVIQPGVENRGPVSADGGWQVPVSRTWRHIVVHHSASASGSAAEFDKYHREHNGWDGLGYHFVIGNGNGTGDGVVEVGYRWTRQMQGAHAGVAEYNQAGIGICLVGDFEHGGPPTARQMASLQRLIRFLQSETGIPATSVIGHGEVPGKKTDCPGRYLSASSIRVSLGGGGGYSGPVQVARSAPSAAGKSVKNMRASGGGSASLP